VQQHGGCLWLFVDSQGLWLSVCWLWLFGCQQPQPNSWLLTALIITIFRPGITLVGLSFNTVSQVRKDESAVPPLPCQFLREKEENNNFI
jgi:hypothetical protein